MKEALGKIGYLGDVPCSYEANPMAAHFELHIEQGPRLESTGHHAGVVTGAQAFRWSRVQVVGSDAHSGTTAFEYRADAMYAAAQMMVQARQLAAAHGCLATVGIVEVSPGSVNTIPGLVSFSLDLRGPSLSTVQMTESELKSAFEAIAQNEGSSRSCTVEWRLDFESSDVTFHPECIDCIRDSAEAVVSIPASQVPRLISGASHDSVCTSRRVPTAMVFVPCRDGVSHHPREYCAPQDCAIGASVLFQAVVRYDRKRFNLVS